MPSIKVSLIFPSGARIGPGKVRLLESVRDTGSISAAARDMGMSYKRAWLLIESMNAAFRKPVVIAATGGRRGGGAALTPFGVDVLTRYNRIASQALAAGKRDLAALARVALPEAGPKV